MRISILKPTNGMNGLPHGSRRKSNVVSQAAKPEQLNYKRLLNWTSRRRGRAARAAGIAARNTRLQLLASVTPETLLFTQSNINYRSLINKQFLILKIYCHDINRVKEYQENNHFVNSLVLNSQRDGQQILFIEKSQRRCHRIIQNYAIKIAGISYFNKMR